MPFIRPLTHIGPFCAALALAGCTPPEGGLPDITYTQLYAAAEVVFPLVEGATPTPITDMPVSGTASYVGIVGLSGTALPDAHRSAEALGQLSLDADFASSAVSGSMSDFHETSGLALGGALNITNGQITGNGFDADVSGALTCPGCAADISGTMSGEFLGADAGQIRGTILGTRTFPNTTTLPYFGVIAGQRVP